MKNDIDTLLESMFRNGRLNLNNQQKTDKKTQNSTQNSVTLTWDPAENTAAAERAVKSVENSAGVISSNLQQSIENLTRETQADLAELEQHLQRDGIENSTAKNGGNAKNIDAAFETAKRETCERVIGQDDFVSALALVFKRPFVVGSESSQPLCRAAIIGKKGSGRHTALRTIVDLLARQGVLKSPKLVFVDLQNYSEADSEKLLIQDLYSALKSGAVGLVFENYQECHPSVLTMISQLFNDGRLPLQGRYAEQKGMLVDIGTALVPNAVSSISAAGKYLFLLTDKPESKLADAFGAPFLTSLDDVVKLNSFTDESLIKIAESVLQRLSAKTVKQFNFTSKYDSAAVRVFADEFNASQGVVAIERKADTVYKALSEIKLKQNVEYADVNITAENGKLLVTYTVMGEPLVLSLAADSDESAQNAAVDEVKRELAEIIGLADIKNYILSLEDNFKIQRLRRERGLKAESPSMHMIFTGNPGTGKTTVARIVSRYLKAIGVLSGGQLVEVTRADLVGKYVGHTAPLTAKAIQSALGGVLFIDEAYSLFRGKDDSFGLEAIDTLVKGMEDNRDNLLVILAGYSREMEEFLTANSGLRSRFPNIIEFPDYTAGELFEITESIVRGKGYRLHDKCKVLLTDYYEKMQKNGDPRTNGNGRMARNKVEEAVLNCSSRNIKLPPEQQDLELLLPEDFEQEVD